MPYSMDQLYCVPPKCCLPDPGLRVYPPVLISQWLPSIEMHLVHESNVSRVLIHSEGFAEIPYHDSYLHLNPSQVKSLAQAWRYA